MSQLPHLSDASIELDNRVATLTFQRDDVRNALTGTELIDDIVQTVAWANLNQDVSALIITGEGKAFSSGGNVKEMREKQGTFGGAAAEIQDRSRQPRDRLRPLRCHAVERRTPIPFQEEDAHRVVPGDDRDRAEVVDVVPRGQLLVGTRDGRRVVVRRGMNDR